MNKTILIKLSGESLSGSIGHGLDFEYIKKICSRKSTKRRIYNR